MIVVLNQQGFAKVVLSETTAVAEQPAEAVNVDGAGEEGTIATDSGNAADGETAIEDEIAAEGETGKEGEVTTDVEAGKEGEAAFGDDGFIAEDGQVSVDAGDMGYDMTGMGYDMTGMEGATTQKSSVMASWPFVIGISSATLVVSIVLGILLAKKRIKKGFDAYED
ncbi:MAG: hypothetical protein PUC65_12345 [Clostridiales bacterium]|nr:hypothetical protein [Clostridiales bacterium]